MVVPEASMLCEEESLCTNRQYTGIAEVVCERDPEALDDEGAFSKGSSLASDARYATVR